MPDWALRRRRILGDHSPQPVVVMDASATEVDLAGAAELPVLRALLRIAEAVARASYFDEALEAIAEQALIALTAASASISRWDPEHDVVRTLINVGALMPGEERWPDDEAYPVIHDEAVTRLMEQGQSYVFAVDDDDADPAEVAWLREIGKESELAVPIMYEDRVWGELWVTGDGGRRFHAEDMQLLQAVAAYAAMAIGRSELLSTIWRFAHQDPLTGLPNRRDLERCFHDIDWEEQRPVVLLCDLDRFKEVNDQHGHSAGDDLLRKVAAILDDTASSHQGAIAARLGGDEFCVVLPQSTLEDAEQFARDVSCSVRQSIGTGVTLSWGASIFGSDTNSAQQLIASADTALLEAKSLGPGRFSIGVGPSPGVRTAAGRKKTVAERAELAASLLVPTVVASLDQVSPIAPEDALELLAREVHRVIDAAGWALSEISADGTYVCTIRGVDSVRDPTTGMSFLRRLDVGSEYPLADYPVTASAMERGDTYLQAIDLVDSDPPEREMLERLGYRAVLGVGVDRRFLLEIYSATGHHELSAIAGHVRLLAHFCTTRNG